MNNHVSSVKGEGVVAVVRRGNRYLMIKRAEHLRAGGMWCFVGGAIEPGETQVQALIREVKEEVGLDIQPLKKVWECLSYNGDWLLHCWEVGERSGNVSPNDREVAEYRWLTPAEIVVLSGVMPSVVEYFSAQGLI